MLRFGNNSLRIVSQRGWVRAPVGLFSSDSKKSIAGLTDLQKAASKNGSTKIVTVGSPKSTPLSIAKVNFASAPAKPPPSQSSQDPPTAEPTGVEPPKSGDGGNYRKFILPVLVTLGAISGIYYSGILESREDKEKKSKTKKDVTVPKRVPLKADDIPSKVKYLLIGGGTASFAAFRAIKANDPKAKILVISDEEHHPYMRPPLSKEIWQYDDLPADQSKLAFKQWNGKERSLYYEPSEFYLQPEKLNENENGGVAVATGWQISRVEAEKKKAFVKTDTGEDKEIEYDRCLIATGCRSKSLPQFDNKSKEVTARTVLLRNIRDLDRLWKKIQDSTTKTVVIVGGGFLGSELACSLARNKMSDGRKIIQIFKEPGNMGKTLPEYLGKWTTDRVKMEGAEVMADTEIKDVEWRNGKVLLKLNNDRQLNTDLVILAVGCEANTELADESKLEIDPNLGGFLVNAELEARRDLFVAGDAACFYDPALGRRRVEHHDHAVVSGRLAGENMVFEHHRPYRHQSMFWSDLSADLGYEAIGMVDSSLQTVGVFAAMAEAVSSKNTEKPLNESDKDLKSASAETIDTTPKEARVIDKKNYSKGVVFYLKADKIVGIVLWNIYNRMSVARQVLAQGKTYEDLNEVAKLFYIHDED